MGDRNARIAGRIIVITGAAGGLGAATARAFAARGARVVLIDTNAETIASLQAELGEHVVWAGVADVRSEEALRQIANTLVAKGHGVDVLINNAAVYVQGPLLDLAAGDFERCVDVNLHGMVRCCRVFVPMMRGRAGAQILNVLSEFAWLPFPNKASYCASKSAMAMASACLRTELAHQGIHVSDFVPPAVDTGLVRDAKAIDPARLAREADVLRAHAKPASDVARAIVQTVERPRDLATYGAMTWLAVRASRLAPDLTRRAAARMARRLGLA